MDKETNLFQRLARSKFRSRFHLGVRERTYCTEKGLETVDKHAADFVKQRLADAEPKNDGKQTPMRGHPVFIAQHATATCCRGCLAKWHNIGAHQPLSVTQQAYIVKIIHRWIAADMSKEVSTMQRTNPRRVTSKKSSAGAGQSSSSSSSTRSGWSWTT